MFLEIIRAFTLIFFAEMGDKSQILAMTFASRYKLKHVIIGISVGIFFNHALAVLLGAFIPDLFNISYLSFIAGILFILFGLFSLQTTEEVDEIKKSKRGITFTIAFALFIGELGDKTQLSTIILASETTYPLLLLITTVTAMILTSLLGIYIGVKFGSKIPDFYLKITSSIIFIFFGVLKVLNNIPESLNNTVYLISIAIVLIVVYGFLLFRYNKNYRTHESVYKKKAEELRLYYLYIKDKLEDLCLGLESCKTCQEEFCLVGYTKSIVRKTLEHKPVKLVDLSSKVRKVHDKLKIEEALKITLDILKDNWTNVEYFNLHEIRKSLELLLYDQFVEVESYEDYKIKKISIQ